MNKPIHIAQPTGGELHRAVNPHATQSLKELKEQAKHIAKATKLPYINALNYLKNSTEKNAEVYENIIYQILVYRNEHADFWVNEESWKGRCTYLSIKRFDKEPICDWQDFQTIKNRLVGTEIEAIQIYPKESRMMNTANQYHLFCFPEDMTIPFGQNMRHVVLKRTVGSVNKTGQEYKGDIYEGDK